MIISYVLAGLAAFLSGLCYIEYVVETPLTGGAFNYMWLTFGELAAWYAPLVSLGNLPAKTWCMVAHDDSVDRLCAQGVMGTLGHRVPCLMWALMAAGADEGVQSCSTSAGSAVRRCSDLQHDARFWLVIFVYGLGSAAVGAVALLPDIRAKADRPLTQQQHPWPLAVQRPDIP